MITAMQQIDTGMVTAAKIAAGTLVEPISSSPHPSEWWFLVMSTLAVCSSTWLFLMKLGDLVQVKRRKQNGPILYMVMDKIRHQAFMLAWSTGMMMLAIAAINNPATPIPQALNLINGATVASCAIIVDGLFTIRRRKRLAAMIAAYDEPPKAVAVAPDLDKAS